MPSSGSPENNHARALALKGSSMASMKSVDTQQKDNTVENTARPKAASPNGKASHAPNSNDLVLQIFSHVRTQKKLEQEREVKISRTERKRQKLKKQLATASSSSASSRDGFGPRWTQARGGYGPLGQRQQNGDQLASNSAKSVKNHVVPFGDSSNGNDRFQNSTADAATISTGTSTEEDQIASFDTWQNLDDNQTSSLKAPQNTHRSNVDYSVNNRPHGAFHVIKGPGRVQIKFTPSNSRPSSKADPGREKKYQWDNMPAGTFLPSHMAVVTIDSRVL